MVPEDAGVASWEMHKLERLVKKKVAQKKAEIYQYELTKFALGESNDLHEAKRNAESLGRCAYDKAEEEKAKSQAAQQAKQVKPQVIPHSILQQYEIQMHREQVERMRKMYASQQDPFGIGYEDRK